MWTFSLEEEEEGFALESKHNKNKIFCKEREEKHGKRRANAD